MNFSDLDISLRQLWQYGGIPSSTGMMWPHFAHL